MIRRRAPSIHSSPVHRAIRLVCLLLTLISAQGCLSTTGPRERVLTFEVAETVVPCMTMFETTCLQVRERTDAPWQAFSTPIEGFQYTPGYRYTLRVVEREIPNPPADGSSLAYRLVAVLAKVAVPAAAA